MCPMAAFAKTKPIELYFFEGQGCPHCARMKSFVEGLKSDYPDLKVYDFEVYFNAENQALFRKMAEAYGVNSNGVPAIFIGEEAIFGENFEMVKNAVEKCSREECTSPRTKLESAINENQNTNINQPAGQNKNETVGWVIIGVAVFAGLFAIFYLIKKRNV